MFPKVCHVQILSDITIIKSSVLLKCIYQEHVYKEHNKYIESKLNRRVNQDITQIQFLVYNISYEMMLKPKSMYYVALNSDGNYP